MMALCDGGGAVGRRRRCRSAATGGHADTPGVLHTVWPAMQALHAQLQPPDALPTAPKRRADPSGPTEVAASLSDAPPEQGDWFDAWLGYEGDAVAGGTTLPKPSADDDAHVRVNGTDSGLQLLRSRPRPLGDLFDSRMGLPQLREGRALEWQQGDKVGEVYGTTSADTLRTPLAQLGFGLVAVAGTSDFDVVNLLKTNLDLCGAATSESALVKGESMRVWRYAKTGKYGTPSEVVSMCEAFVAECTHRFVMCAALRTPAGIDSRDAEQLTVAADILAALQEVENATTVQIRFTSGNEGSTAISRLLTQTIVGFLRSLGIPVEGPTEAASPQVSDVRDYVATLFARLAAAAYDGRSCYRLLYPMQVARVDAETVLRAGTPQQARVQVPATQAAEYGAVTAMRETYGMQAGVSARNNWQSISSIASELMGHKNNAGVRDNSGVRVVTGPAVVAMDDVLNSSPPGGAAVSQRFAFLNTDDDEPYDVDAQSIWIYETDARVERHEERATLVYMALRIAAAAAATPALGEPVLRQVTLLRYEDDTDAFATTRARDQQPVYAWSTGPFKMGEVARVLIDRLEQGTTGMDRLAIHVSLGPMRLPRGPQITPKDAPEGLEVAFPRGVGSTSIVSCKRMRESLERSLPELAADPTDVEKRSVRIGQTLDMLSAAGAMRGGVYIRPDDLQDETYPGEALDARDVARVTSSDPSNDTAQKYARFSSHSRASSHGTGYADHTEAVNHSLICSFSTPGLYETWGSLGTFSPASAQRASEALRVAAVAAALRRQQVEPGEFTNKKEGRSNALPLDDDDELLRAMLLDGETQTGALRPDQLQAMLTLAVNGRAIEALRGNTGASFEEQAAVFTDLFGRMALVLRLATSSGNHRYIEAAAIMAAAIYSSPLGEQGMQGVHAIFRVLRLGFNGQIAKWFVVNVFGPAVSWMLKRSGKVATETRGYGALVVGLGLKAGALLTSLAGAPLAKVILTSGPTLGAAVKNFKTVGEAVRGLLPDMLVKDVVLGKVLALTHLRQVFDEVVFADGTMGTFSAYLSAAFIAFGVEGANLALSEVLNYRDVSNPDSFSYVELLLGFDPNVENKLIVFGELPDESGATQPPGEQTDASKAEQDATRSDPNGQCNSAGARFLKKIGLPETAEDLFCERPPSPGEGFTEGTRRPAGGAAPETNSATGGAAFEEVTTERARAQFRARAEATPGVPRLETPEATDDLARVTRFLARTAPLRASA